MAPSWRGFWTIFITQKDWVNPTPSRLITQPAFQTQKILTFVSFSYENKIVVFHSHPFSATYFYVFWHNSPVATKSIAGGNLATSRHHSQKHSKGFYYTFSHLLSPFFSSSCSRHKHNNLFSHPCHSITIINGRIFFSPIFTFSNPFA